MIPITASEASRIRVDGPEFSRASSVQARIESQIGKIGDLFAAVQDIIGEIAALQPPRRGAEEQEREFRERLREFQQKLNDLNQKLQDAQRKLAQAEAILSRMQSQELPEAERKDAEEMRAAIDRVKKQLEDEMKRMRERFNRDSDQKVQMRVVEPLWGFRLDEDPSLRGDFRGYGIALEYSGAVVPGSNVPTTAAAGLPADLDPADVAMLNSALRMSPTGPTVDADGRPYGISDSVWNALSPEEQQLTLDRMGITHGATVGDGVDGVAPVNGETTPLPVDLQPVQSFDISTAGTRIGNPPEYRLTQQQMDVLLAHGFGHGVIGLPTPRSGDYDTLIDATHQELDLLNANGIQTDVYEYLYWSDGAGHPRAEDDVRAEVRQRLDDLADNDVGTFWLDVEFDDRPYIRNPSMGAETNQALLDAAMDEFKAWKEEHPDSTIEVGIYTSPGAWSEMSKGPNDPYNTRYADEGVPLWVATYASDFNPGNDPFTGDTQDMVNQKMQQGFGTDDSPMAFGGWSLADGNIAGWQFRAGEHDGHFPTFEVGLDRNVWLLDQNQPDAPVTAYPSGPRDDLLVQNHAMAALLAHDADLPVEQRTYKTMQNVINACLDPSSGVTFKSLGIDESEAYAHRYEDPWKVVYGLPLGTDQISDTPLNTPDAPTQTPIATPADTPTAPVDPGLTTSAGQLLALVGLAPGASSSADAASIKLLQDELMQASALADIHDNPGYGSHFGPLTEAALKTFQTAQQLVSSGVVDNPTIMAFARMNGTDMGFDTSSPYAQLYGLEKGATSQDGYGPQIAALQDRLTSLDYLQQLTPAAGYGIVDGPLTTSALKHFQIENGIAPTGVVDGATIAAFSYPAPRPASWAAGPAQQYRAALGLATGEPHTLADGTVRQDFEHGYVALSADRLRSVVVNGMDLVPPTQLGISNNTAAANNFFLTQWGPTPYNSANGAPYGYEDCGPTSSVMVLSALGLLPHPTPDQAEGAIDHMRDLILDNPNTPQLENSTESEGLDPWQLVDGLEAAGAHTQYSPATLDSLDAAIGRGDPVIVGSGKTWDAWGNAQNSQDTSRSEFPGDNYLNSRDPGGHFVAVLGKTDSGNYIVGDPLVKGGTIEVTPNQMQTALNGSFGDDVLEVSSSPIDPNS